MGAGREARIFKHSHRSIPEDGLGRSDDLRVAADSIRPDIKAFTVIRNVTGVDPGIHKFKHRTTLFVDLTGVLQVRDDGVGRQQKRNAPIGRLGLGRQGRAGVVLLDQRFSGLATVSQLEGVGHGSSDEDRVGFVQQAVDDLDLVAHFGASEDHHERTGRILQLITQKLQLPLHQKTGRSLATPGSNDAGHAAGRGMSPVSSTECVVHIDISQPGQPSSKDGIIGFFFRLEAHVFENKDLAILQSGGGGLGLFTHRLVHKAHRATQHFGQLHGHRGQAHRRFPLAVRATQMGCEDDSSPLGNQQFQRRQGFFNAGSVIDLHHPVPLLHRDVVIDAH